MISINGESPVVQRLLKEFMVILVLSASSNCYGARPADDRREKLRAGMQHIASPGRGVGWQVEGTFEGLILAMPSECMRHLLDPSRPSKLNDAFDELSQYAIQDNFLETLIKQLWQNLDVTDEASAYLRDGILISILSQLLLRTGFRDASATSIAMPMWRLKRVQQYVETHLSEPVRLEDLAAVAGVSKRHFARSFQQEIGESPFRWLMQRRLEHAKSLLEGTDIPLCEVALMCGFSGQSHLTRMLKQSVGSTPYRWRQQFREFKDNIATVLT
jgi:AraC family transcriptional regulator